MITLGTGCDKVMTDLVKVGCDKEFLKDKPVGGFLCHSFILSMLFPMFTIASTITVLLICWRVWGLLVAPIIQQSSTLLRRQSMGSAAAALYVTHMTQSFSPIHHWQLQLGFPMSPQCCQGFCESPLCGIILVGPYAHRYLSRILKKLGNRIVQLIKDGMLQIGIGAVRCTDW